MRKSDQQLPGSADSVSDAKPMNPHQWRRIKGILDQVSTASAKQRADLIRDTCGDDSDLYREVMSFLSLDSRAETFMDEPLWRLPADIAELTPEMPERLGPYRLLKPLGRGGMGKVYLAVREDDYRQEVAIKSCIGPAKHDLQARFLGERQILARLEHPGIARLLDGGTDPMGFPYLVMEYVEGRPIDEYCQEESLSLRDRLALVAEICRIVHYAHRNLVVHRDLKPSNILVDSEGRPRLLDFGIAKILDAPVGDGITIQGHLVMTPSCASPEQISGDLITTASDIYSLGVLLHCLLTDSPPYDLTHLPLPQAALLVCSQGVGKPSTAAEEQGKPRLVKRLRGDLDAIVTTAGRKEPEHRYSSAAEMAEDIDSYLEGLPVQARKGNWYYQISRHIRRNKPLVASLSLIAALILVSLMLGWKSEMARRDAISAQRSAESIKDVLFQLLTAPAPDKAKGRDRTVREVLLEAAPVIEAQLTDRPDIQAEAYSTLANMFSELGDDQTALELQTSALEKRLEHSSEASKSLADDIADLGRANYNLGHFDKAEGLYVQALEMRQGLRAPPLELAQTLLNLANTRGHLGQVEGIEEDLLEVLGLRRQHNASKLEIADVLYSLGAWELKIGRADQAIDYLSEGLEIRRQELGDEHTKVAAVAKSLARAYHATGRLQEAKELYVESLETRIRRLGEDHPDVPTLQVAFARLLLDSGEEVAALELAVQATQRSLVLHGAEDPLTIEAQSVRAACALALKPSDAEKQQLLTQVRQGYESLKVARGEQDFVTRWTYRILSAQENRRAALDRGFNYGKRNILQFAVFRYHDSFLYPGGRNRVGWASNSGADDYRPPGSAPHWRARSPRPVEFGARSLSLPTAAAIFSARQL